MHTMEQLQMAQVDRIHRLFEMCDLLQPGYRFNTKVLADILRVSRRTVFRDLQLLKECGVTIHYDQDAQQYCVPCPLRFPPREASLDELSSLVALPSRLSATNPDDPLLRDAHRAAMKLLNTMPVTLRTQILKSMNGIEIEQPQNKEHIDEHDSSFRSLRQAHRERRAVRIQYLDEASDAPAFTLLFPYALAFRDSDWFVVGRSSYHRRVRAFDLGAIRSTEVQDQEFDVPPRFRPERYLRR
jgi:predicted DNA-binding transcriptional regulator YafY